MITKTNRFRNSFKYQITKIFELKGIIFIGSKAEKFGQNHFLFLLKMKKNKMIAENPENFKREFIVCLKAENLQLILTLTIDSVLGSNKNKKSFSLDSKHRL